MLLAMGIGQGLIREVNVEWLPFVVIGASVHPFLTPESVRRLTGKDPLDPKWAAQYADLVLDMLFTALQSPKNGQDAL